jgi:hypothetical protein
MVYRVILFILLFAVPAFGATQYVVQSSGTGAVDSSTSCTDAVDIADINTDMTAELAGDTLVMCDVMFTAGLEIDGDGITVEADTGASPVFSGMTNCITATDDDDLSISDISCQDSTGVGILITITANITTGITLDNITVNNSGTHGIHFDMSDGIVATNVTLSNSTISNWGQVTAGSRGIFLDESAFNGDYVNVQILRNEVYRDNVNGSEVSSQDGIIVHVPDGGLIEDNEIHHIGAHGIWVTGGASQACNASADFVIRANYIHDTNDDCMWLQACQGADKIKVHSNWCVNTYDDCFDIALGDAWIVNNTCYSPQSACVDFEGVGTNLTGTYRNNLCVFTEAPAADNDGVFRHWFLSLGNGAPTPEASQLDSDYNIFYDATETGGDAFFSEDEGETITFTEWKSIDSDDLNSIEAITPELVDNKYPEKRSISRHKADTSVCSGTTEVLTRDSVWVVGQEVETINPCDPAIEQRLDIGAFDIPNYLEGE